VQAGAKTVYAVEASGMVKFARQLAAANGTAGAAIEVVHSRIETASLPEKADVLISEPMGTLLVNERMLETYVYARKHLLKPGGKMFPSLGRIFVAAFSDEGLHTELTQKALFWTNPSFYGVNLTALHPAAVEVRFRAACPVCDKCRFFILHTSRPRLSPRVSLKKPTF
jgi:histone-arginine methyltransferase CARM1